MGGFHLVSEFRPRGDQPQAISRLVEGLEKGHDHHALASVYEADYVTVPATVSEEAAAYASEKELPVMIAKLKEEMKRAAKELEFEKAAELRDRIRDLTKLMLEMGGEG